MKDNLFSIDTYNLEAMLTSLNSIEAMFKNRSINQLEVSLNEEKDNADVFAEISSKLDELEFVSMLTDQSFSTIDKKSLFIKDQTEFVVLTLDNDAVGVKYYGSDPEMYYKIHGLLSDLKKNETPKKKGRVFTIVNSDMGGMVLKSLGMGGVPLERGNYNSKVIKDLDHVVKDLNSDSPCGRLILFEGDAGGGKTYLVRSLIDSIEGAIFILLSPDIFANLQQPQLVNMIIDNHRSRDKKLVFIVEDADSCLLPRQSDNMGSINTLLNFGSGILGSLLDVRIICTTNADKNEIDSAILRPGRLCKRIHVPDLTVEEANAVYTRLTNGKDLNALGLKKRSLSLAEVYHLSLNQDES